MLGGPLRSDDGTPAHLDEALGPKTVSTSAKSSIYRADLPPESIDRKIALLFEEL
jgi:hypothetical protein